MKRRSPYADRILQVLVLGGCTNVDPRHIEAYMRLSHSTLDGLGSEEFIAAIWDAFDLVKQSAANVESEAAESLARSMGL